MQEIASAIREGAIAYLNRQLKSMGITGLVIFVVIVFALGLKTALGFLVGAVASFAAGYIGMRVSVLANVRTAEAARGGMAAGLRLAFQGGSVTGMIVAGLALAWALGGIDFFAAWWLTALLALPFFFRMAQTGIAGLPQMPVLTSGYVHAATRKVLALQGVGRSRIQEFKRDERIMRFLTVKLDKHAIEWAEKRRNKLKAKA